MPLITALIFSALPVLIYWLYNTETIYLHAISVFSTLLSTSAGLNYCLTSSPLLPPPKVLSDSLRFDISESAFADQVWLLDTSYAIKASIGDLTIYEHEYSAPGREVVQSLLDTSFRVGSVTKTFTVLAILRSADKIKLSDSITKFIPELSKELDSG